MNARNFILLYTVSVVFMISSCTKKRNDSILTTPTTDSAEKKRADSIVSSIKGKTKTITINASKENTISSKKGVKFSIPAHAFVTQNGTKPKGNIQVTISEYHNPADILASNIRMQYQTKEGATQMESAGMFSITARAKDEVLQLASGKDISVQVPSKNSDPDFNLYYFDPAKNAWVHTFDSLPATTPAKELEAIATNQPSKQEAPETGSSLMNVEWAAVEANKRIIDGKTVNLVRPDCSYKNTDFDFTVVTDNFPELKLYKETVWMGCSNYDETIVTAAFDNDKLISATIRGRETLLNRYLISFEFKHTKFNAHMKIASKAESCEINEEIYFSYYDNRPVNEKKIEKVKTTIKKNKQQADIIRSFTINQLGLWNCDRLYTLPAKMIIIPRFRSITTGASYESTTTYLIDKNINSVWTFTKTITLNPDADNIVLFVNEKGKICYARLNKLSKTHKEKTLNLIIDVEEMTDKPDNTEELDSLLKKI